MGITRGTCASLVALATALLVSAASVEVEAQQSATSGIGIGDGDLGGVVRSPKGAEAGVWVIAETTDLPTKFAKMVVTDDQGRYVLPDLPKANYNIWVRGYGLVDSVKVQSAPGRILDLTAVAAPSAAAAAEYYPAIYWFAMLKIPAMVSGTMTRQWHPAALVAQTTSAPASRPTAASPPPAGNKAAHDRRARHSTRGGALDAAHQLTGQRRYGRHRFRRRRAETVRRLTDRSQEAGAVRAAGPAAKPSATSWSAWTGRSNLHDRSRPTAQPAVNANGLIFGRPNGARFCRSRPGQERGERDQVLWRSQDPSSKDVR